MAERNRWRETKRDRGRGRLKLWQKERVGERYIERKNEIEAERKRWRETERDRERGRMRLRQKERGGEKQRKIEREEE